MVKDESLVLLVSDIHYERAYHHNVWEGDAFDWLVRVVQRFRPSSLIALGDLGHAWLAADWKSLTDLTAVNAIYGNHDNLEVLRSAGNSDGSRILAEDGEIRVIGGLKVGFINGIMAKKGKLKLKDGVPRQSPEDFLSAAEKLAGVDVLCTRGNTIVLGSNKPISRCEVGDTCLGLSGEAVVTKTYKRPFNGEMVSVKAEGLTPLVGTPEHPVLASTLRIVRHNTPDKWIFSTPKWKSLGSVKRVVKNKSGDFLAIPRLKGTVGTKSLSLASFCYSGQLYKAKRTSIPLDSEMAWLMGLYVAEGHCPSNFRSNRLVFSLNSTELNLANRVRRILTRLGYASGHIEKFRSHNGIQLSIGGQLLGRAFKNWFGDRARNKYIPKFILFNNSKTILRSFVEGYFAGDGGYEIKGAKHVTRRSTTASKVLALQLQLICARLGFLAGIYKGEKGGKARCEIRGKEFHNHRSYRFGYSPQIVRRRHKVTADYIFVPVRHVSRRPHRGVVYNLETSDNTYFMSNAITHNCTHASPNLPEYAGRYHASEEFEILDEVMRRVNPSLSVSGHYSSENRQQPGRAPLRSFGLQDETDQNHA